VAGVEGRPAVDGLFDVAGKRVLVAGSANGLGRVLVEAFAARGAHCLVADLDETGARTVAAELPGAGHDGCFVDVTDANACAEAVARSVRDGGLDVLINSAGRLHLAPALDLEAADFESVLRINTTGSFLLARAAAHAMQPARRGRIITIASASSRVANANYAAYATSKGALVQLTRILALEWAPHNITVNAIGPAMTLTPMTERYLDDPQLKAHALSCIPLGRFGEARDIVGMALLLAAPAGEFITGQTIYVDGGRTLR